MRNETEDICPSGKRIGILQAECANCLQRTWCDFTSNRRSVEELKEIEGMWKERERICAELAKGYDEEVFEKLLTINEEINRCRQEIIKLRKE